MVLAGERMFEETMCPIFCDVQVPGGGLRILTPYLNLKPVQAIISPRWDTKTLEFIKYSQVQFRHTQTQIERFWARRNPPAELNIERILFSITLSGINSNSG